MMTSAGPDSAGLPKASPKAAAHAAPTSPATVA